jgi:hypothetical protein
VIVLDNAFSGETLLPSAFNSEAELEQVICRYPQLLQRGEDASLSLVDAQVSLPSGIMDVLLLDSEGLPVAVEVKLGRNPESRRQVVGQLIDYVATLTAYTVDELNAAVGGKLDLKIREISDSEANAKKLWQAFGTNLRAGLARYVIVLDDVPSDLARIVKFLATRSNLDIRLVQISKYISNAGQISFVPDNLVDESDFSMSSQTPSSELSDRLQAVLAAYANIPSVLPLRGRAKNYRQILPDGWPSAVHYEFMERSKGVQVDIHLEGKAVQHLAAQFQRWAHEPPEGLGFRLVWDAKWYQGRISAQLGNEPTAERVATAMAKLIELTQPTISRAILDQRAE